MSAYVMQDDILYAHLTVYETLRLAATFHFPSHLIKKKILWLILL